MLFGGYFGDSIFVDPATIRGRDGARNSTAPRPMALHGFTGAAVLAGAGGRRDRLVLLHEAPGSAGRDRGKRAALVVHAARSTSTTSTDSTTGSSPAARAVSAAACGSAATSALIDGVFVNGTARLVGWFAGVVRAFQSGYIYHYAFCMIIGVFVLLTLLVCCARDGGLSRHEQQACFRTTSLSLVDLAADRRRACWCWPPATTATRALARWLALVGAIARACWSRSRCRPASTRGTTACSSSRWRPGSRASTSTTTSASTASRCCSSCSTASSPCWW